MVTKEYTQSNQVFELLAGSVQSRHKIHLYQRSVYVAGMIFFRFEDEYGYLHGTVYTGLNPQLDSIIQNLYVGDVDNICELPGMDKPNNLVKHASRQELINLARDNGLVLTKEDRAALHRELDKLGDY